MASLKQTIWNARRNASVGAARWLLAAGAGAVLFATAPLAANAGPPAADAPSVAVSYGDLNLQTEHGARTLLQRIRLAAQEVCPQVPDNRDLSRIEARILCMHRAVARAVQQVGSPRLAAVLSARAPHG